MWNSFCGSYFIIFYLIFIRFRTITGTRLSANNVSVPILHLPSHVLWFVLKHWTSVLLTPHCSQVRMGNLNFSLGRVQYDTQSLSTFPLEAQVGVGVGASIVALIVLVIVLIYRYWWSHTLSMTMALAKVFNPPEGLHHVLVHKRCTYFPNQYFHFERLCSNIFRKVKKKIIIIIQKLKYCICISLTPIH